MLDEDGQFVSKKLNSEMVKVYPLVECADDEIEELKSLIEKHVEYTGSQRGRDVLSDWDRFVNQFLKVLPEDYERVLLALKKAEERGLEGDEAIQAAFEENVAAGH